MEFGGKILRKMSECKFVTIEIVKKMGFGRNGAFL